MFRNELQKWALQNSIESRTKDLFYKALDIYKREENDRFIRYFGIDFNINDLYVFIHDVSARVVGWNDEDYVEVIIVCINVHYGDDLFCEYFVTYSLDGEAIDDVFELSPASK